MTQEDIRIMADEKNWRVYEGYSGRMMFGMECIGIITDDPTSVIEKAASRGIRGAKYDQLGKGWIVYWPDIQK